MRITSKDVECPSCGAQPGEKCRGSAYGGYRGRHLASYHPLRVEKARDEREARP